MQAQYLSPLLPDYWELTYGRGNNTVDSSRIGEWSGDSSYIEGTFGWMLTKPGTSDEEKAAWRALRDANLQHDAIAASLEQATETLAAISVTLEDMGSIQAAPAPEEPEHQHAPPPETSLTLVITTAVAILAGIAKQVFDERKFKAPTTTE